MDLAHHARYTTQDTHITEHTIYETTEYIFQTTLRSREF